MRRIAGAMILGVLLVLSAMPLAASAAPIPTANKRAAASFAKQWLAKYRPPGTRISGDPTHGGMQCDACQLQPGGARVGYDEHSFWIVKQTPKQFIAALSAHPPIKTSIIVQGEGGGGSPGHIVNTRSLQFTIPHQPAGVGFAQLEISATAAKGGTAVRVDSYAIPFRPRPRSERLPSGIHAATVSVASDGIRHRWGLGSVTNPQALARLTRAVDSEHVGQPGAGPVGCAGVQGNRGAPLIDIRFQTRPGSRTLAEARESSCIFSGGPGSPAEFAPPVAFSVHGKAEAPLEQTVGMENVLAQSGILHPCTSSQMSLKPGSQFSTRVGSGDLKLTDRGTPCGLSGQPKLTLSTAANKPFPPQRTYKPGPYKEVPDHVLITPDYPGSVNFTWTPASKSCPGPTASSASLLLPGATQPLSLSLAYSKTPLAACRGRYTVWAPLASG
ncbi:MAG: hypothetical protein J2O48_06375 [Solirubrobacterales bacterium]|nr:hypothetical protein [Solirubrobacterales bacterium]